MSSHSDPFAASIFQGIVFDKSQAPARRKVEALGEKKKAVEIEGPLADRRVVSFEVPEFPAWAKAQGLLDADAGVTVVSPTLTPALREHHDYGRILWIGREYRPGDDPRLIHWRSSAKTGALTVRELEAETAVDTRLVLEGRSGDADAVERGLSRAASFVVHLIRAGAAVELLGPGVFVPLGRGLAHQRRLLTALALWTPAAAGPSRGGPRSSIREIRVRLG